MHQDTSTQIQQLKVAEFVFSFNAVNGDTGISTTNISKLDNGTAFGYDQHCLRIY
jgi:uncharacterized protein YerC